MFTSPGSSRDVYLRSGLLALSVIVAGVSMTPVAFAQDDVAEKEAFEPKGGVYVTALGGVSLPSDAEYSGVQQPAAGVPGAAGAPANVNAELSSGAFVSGAIGYRIPKHVFGLFQPSVEIEVNYTDFDVNGGDFNGGNQTFSGDQNALTVTANYQNDLRWSNNQKVIPFWGGGIGFTRVDNNIAYFPNNGVLTSPNFAVRGSDTGFNLQSNAGLTFILSDKVELVTRVRYQRVTGLDFERRFIANDGFSADVDGRFENVTLAAGLRYRF